MVILVPDSDAAARVARAAGARDVVVDIVGDSSGAGEAVAAARAQHGGAPLGYVARGEAEALQAIGAGADEAMALPSLDSAHVLALLDRTQQRAGRRRTDENERRWVVQSEKLAALGTVVAGVAHELNNPLAAALLSTELVRSRLGPVFSALAELQARAAAGLGLSAEEVAEITAASGAARHALEGKEVLDELMGLIETIAAVVRDLRICARADDTETPQLVNIVDLIEQVLRIVGRELTARGVVERDYGVDLPLLLAPRSRVVQVLTNVLVNAAQALGEIERPLHRVRISVRSDAEALAISVSDTGPGIAAETIERIFDPFYTTKSAGSGTGLGLSISRSILRRLGGDLLVESVHGVGATFVALLPLPSGDALRDAFRTSTLPPPAASSRRASVLVVDDDPRLLRIYPRILGDRYDVLVASDGQEAIDMLSSGSTADVVLTDLAMPDVDGLGLLAWLRQHRPALAARTLFVTATPGTTHAYHRQTVGRPTLEKPASREAIFAAIDALLGAEAADASLLRAR